MGGLIHPLYIPLNLISHFSFGRLTPILSVPAPEFSEVFLLARPAEESKRACRVKIFGVTPSVSGHNGGNYDASRATDSLSTLNNGFWALLGP